MDNSLLTKTEQPDEHARYRMLETIRAYARDRLTELDNAEQVRDRRLSFHLDLTKRAEAGLAGPTSDAWLDRLAADLHDLRAALDHALATGRPLAVLDLAGPILVRALVFRAWCGFYCGTADGEAVRADIDAALGLTERLGDAEANAWALTYAGAVTQRGDTIPAGRAQLEQAIAQMEVGGFTPLLANAYAFLSGMTVFAGELARAREEARLLLRLAREHGQVAFEAIEEVAALAAAQAQLDTDRLTACRNEGRALSLEDAVVYARRGRGERGRPPIGWASLTPTERKVAGLVARGCSNAEIGEQVLVTVNTGKTHLSRIYAKPGLNRRAELAAEAVRQEHQVGGHPAG